jgi:DtxR family Mn-dependent transcriptional regulator
MGWDEVDAEACRLEHAISARVEERLIHILGDPQTCPHGHPIPPLDGSEPARPGIPLAQLDVGSATTVFGVTEDVPEILRYLAEVGLRPGAKVTVFEKAPLGGPMTVGVGDKRHAISLELAAMITVLPEGHDPSA